MSLDERDPGPQEPTPPPDESPFPEPEIEKIDEGDAGSEQD